MRACEHLCRAHAAAWMCKKALGTDPAPDVEDKEPLLCGRSTDPMGWVGGLLISWWHPISSLATPPMHRWGRGLNPSLRGCLGLHTWPPCHDKVRGRWGWDLSGLMRSSQSPATEVRPGGGR